MDSKNVIAAISLSAAVIILYGLFLAPEPQQISQTQQEKNKIVESSEAPKLIDTEEIDIISRDDAIKSSKRISFENNNVIGSISLKGALIDDITFKKHSETIGSEKKVTYLNPEKTKEGYFIETGWAANNIESLTLPNKDTIWKVKGNNKLSNNNPVIIEWSNNSGLVFRKKI